MGRIHVLDDVLANQIAAGEVVERPASVVKELLENAIDAEATAITVELAGGGVALLRVVDDGHGMEPDDARLALQRHATSKVATASDLHHIRTLGFRGEALPSIASVSRLTLRTRQPGAVGAMQIRVEGGREVEAREAAGPVGTEIRVEDLFYNVPARRKFLKRAATEASHVQDAVQRLALCYPEVAFRLVKDGRVAFDLPRHASLLDRVRAIYGATIASRLAPVQVDGVFGIDGLIGPPDEARSTARHYHTFVNGRFVRDRVVMAAVQSAYGSRLDRSRHPFVVLRVRMPPEALDVNVHPAKTEVRFVESGGVHRLVAGAIDRTLREEPWSERAAEGPGRRFALGGVGGLVGGDVAGAASGGEDAGSEEAGGLAGHRQRIFDAMERITARRSGVASRVEAPRTAQLDLGVVVTPAPLRLRPSSGGALRVEVVAPRPARVFSVGGGGPGGEGAGGWMGGSDGMAAGNGREASAHGFDEREGMGEASAHGFDERDGRGEASAHGFDERDGLTEASAHGFDERGGGPEASAHGFDERGALTEASAHGFDAAETSRGAGEAAADPADGNARPRARRTKASRADEMAQAGAAAVAYAMPSDAPVRAARRAAPPPPPLPVLGKRPSVGTLPFEALRPLGPVGGLLLCAAADALVGVDVVAARRRVVYEALRQGGEGRGLGRPVSVELDAGERARWVARGEAIGALGFGIEPFGGATFVIERVPGALDAERAEAALRALLAVEVEDEAALAAVLAGVCAEVMVVEGPIEPAEAGRLLAALGRVEHAPPRSWPVAFVLTEAELRRKLVGR